MSDWTPVYCRACGGLTNPGMAGSDDLCECRRENAPRLAAYQRGFADGHAALLVDVREALRALANASYLSAPDAALFFAERLGLDPEVCGEFAAEAEARRQYGSTLTKAEVRAAIRTNRWIEHNSPDGAFVRNFLVEFMRDLGIDPEDDDE